MSASSSDFLLQILRACERQPPGAPLYPSDYAAQAGTDREQLDQALDQLRLAGLVRLTDWIAGKGQGYALTEEGQAVVRNGQDLERALHRPKPAIAKPELRELTPWERGEAVRDAFLRPAAPLVTLTLMLLNGLVFCAGIGLASYHHVPLNLYFSGSLTARLLPHLQGNGGAEASELGKVYRELGSLNPFDVLVHDQWWRLLTHSFVHGGFLHLLLNMFSLFMLGPLVERMWGSWRFLAIYLISVLVGGCAALLTLRGGIGASGGVAGIMTSLVAWMILNRESLPPQLVNRILGSMFGSLAMLIYFSFLPGVSWEGHLGGAVGGVLASLALQAQRFGRGWQRVVGLLGALLIPAAAVSLVLVVRGNWRTQARAQFAIVQAHLLTSPLRRTLVEAETRCFADYEKYLLPLIKKGLLIKDKNELVKEFPGARGAFERAENDLKTVLDRFKDAEPFPLEDQNEAAKETRVYLQTWAELFSWAKTYCDEPLVENRLELMRAHREWLNLIPAQSRNPYFSSILHAEPKKKQGPKD